MTDRCRWMYDREIGRWHLPGCWGAVNSGPEGCYCEPVNPTIEDRLDRIEAILAGLVTSTASPIASASAEPKASEPPPLHTVEAGR